MAIKGELLCNSLQEHLDSFQYCEIQQRKMGTWEGYDFIWYLFTSELYCLVHLQGFA